MLFFHSLFLLLCSVLSMSFCDGRPVSYLTWARGSTPVGVKHQTCSEPQSSVLEELFKVSVANATYSSWKLVAGVTVLVHSSYEIRESCAMTQTAFMPGMILLFGMRWQTISGHLVKNVLWFYSSFFSTVWRHIFSFTMYLKAIKLSDLYIIKLYLDNNSHETPCYFMKKRKSDINMSLNTLGSSGYGYLPILPKNLPCIQYGGFQDGSCVLGTA